jgi:hypothetical protein
VKSILQNKSFCLFVLFYVLQAMDVQVMNVVKEGGCLIFLSIFSMVGCELFIFLVVFVSF